MSWRFFVGIENATYDVRRIIYDHNIVARQVWTIISEKPYGKRVHAHDRHTTNGRTRVVIFVFSCVE